MLKHWYVWLYTCFKLDIDIEKLDNLKTWPPGIVKEETLELLPACVCVCSDYHPVRCDDSLLVSVCALITIQYNVMTPCLCLCVQWLLSSTMWWLPACVCVCSDYHPVQCDLSVWPQELGQSRESLPQGCGQGRGDALTVIDSWSKLSDRYRAALRWPLWSLAEAREHVCHSVCMCIYSIYIYVCVCVCVCVCLWRDHVDSKWFSGTCWAKQRPLGISFNSCYCAIF